MVNDTSRNETEDVTQYFYQVEQLTFLWILLTCIVIGNATVLVALLLSKGRKSRMNFFIKHLAAADLFVGLISVLTDIIWKITISWEAGLVACKIIRFLQAMVTYASTYVLVALSIDRYDAITHPMNFTGSWRRARVLVIVAWILSAAFASPILHFYNTTETENYGTQCWINFDSQWKWQLYMTLVSLTIFVIPAILIATCYIIIVCTIWKKGRQIKTNHRNQHIETRPQMPGSEVMDDLDSRRASSRGLIPKAKVKTIKMTFVIITVFILCWSPYIIFDLLQVYTVLPDNKQTRAVATFIQSLAPLNSAANPLIYCLFSTNILQTICSILGCRKAPPTLSTGLTTSTNSQSNRPLVGHTASNARSIHLDSELRQPLCSRNSLNIQRQPSSATSRFESVKHSRISS